MRFLSFLVLCILTGCGVIPGKSVPTSGSTSIELGTIGTMSSDDISKRFQLAAIPDIKNGVRVIIEEKSFDKGSAKNFNKLQKETSQMISMKDSLMEPSRFLQLSIGDKVTWLTEVNSQYNMELLTYLKSVPKAVMVSSISISFPNEIHSEIINAQEIYLVNKEKKQYLLELYRDQMIIKTLDLTDGCVFDFEINSFCWAENTKHDIVIVDINENGCQKPAYESFDKVERKKSEFKF